jgi:mRNA interferase RelE/StbE
LPQLKIDFTRDAVQPIEDLTVPKQFRQVVTKILSLLKEPNPADSFALQGYDARRTDIGEYRIVYRYEESDDTLKIIVVAKRNDDEVYKTLKR